ncbi:uncharacterized protein LOC106703884 [Latimeria chalumnae]|uniref:uncharacterized protein LOC106703884 n=1 Tax=Latimeria chalumnae TaxID=7897 RepID=UPI0006D8F380|nr:PREDICTED: uncharacterized protein LOC106703884 [Latimeria chalumnae]|eukprot:XP_014345143.1 PREDICTED: uncharacterized protein LOC106703884 [Latimeria chalumnae]
MIDLSRIQRINLEGCFENEDEQSTQETNSGCSADLRQRRTKDNGSLCWHRPSQEPTKRKKISGRTLWRMFSICCHFRNRSDDERHNLCRTIAVEDTASAVLPRNAVARNGSKSRDRSGADGAADPEAPPPAATRPRSPPQTTEHDSGGQNSALPQSCSKTCPRCEIVFCKKCNRLHYNKHFITHALLEHYTRGFKEEPDFPELLVCTSE